MTKRKYKRKQTKLKQKKTYGKRKKLSSRHKSRPKVYRRKRIGIFKT